MSIRLYWLWPFRDRPEEYAGHEADQWGPYRSCALEADLDLVVIAADDVVVQGAPQGATVLVRGEPVDPTATMFHTGLITWPDYQADVWRYLSTFVLLEAAGFCTLPKLRHNIAGNDKLASSMDIAGSGVPWLPTTRILTRHFVSLSDYVDPDSIQYPVLVKPAAWGGGIGVFRADDRRDLEAMLQMAGAGELAVVIQPWIGTRPSDVRVYCIDGQPLKALAKVPPPGELLSGLAHGGIGTIVDVPERLREPAAAVAARVDLPYVCVDFLVTDDEFWFSEVEVAGDVSVARPGGREIAVARFQAYRRYFDAHVARLGGQPAASAARP